jgi:hypothetical protein
VPDLTPPPLTPDERVGGRYRLVRLLARGGMAEVWEAVDDVLARPVAVKVLLPHLAADEAFVTRFRREAVAAARLSHPHIVAIYDTCTDCDVEAIVMELVRGTTLRAVLDDRGPLPPKAALDIAVQVADALHAAHRQGLIHRDVKPGNILLSDDGRVLVADFGIAKAAEAASDLTEVGQVVGTAKYLSPEQVQGQDVDPRSDVYSLGVVLYEMLCGRPPFVSDNATATAVARLTRDPEPPSSLQATIPPRLEAVVLRALARDPAARYATAGDLRAALLGIDLDRPDDMTAFVPTAAGAAPLVDHDPTPVPPAPAAGPTRRRKRNRAPWVVAGLVGLTLALVALAVAQSGVLDDEGTGPGAAPAEPGESGRELDIVEAQAFDPLGGGGEHDGEAPLVHDGDPSTAWTTEQYRSELAQLKDGVGIWVQVDGPAELGELSVLSPTEGWTAEVYVAESPASSLEGWGAPVAGTDGPVSGDHTFDLGGASGGAVLLWFTDVGDAGQAEVTEIVVRGA